MILLINNVFFLIKSLKSYKYLIIIKLFINTWIIILWSNNRMEHWDHLTESRLYLVQANAMFTTLFNICWRQSDNINITKVRQKKATARICFVLHLVWNKDYTWQAQVYVAFTSVPQTVFVDESNFLYRACKKAIPSCHVCILLGCALEVRFISQAVKFTAFILQWYMD